MGGTFNPIHTGHLILAETAFQQFQLEKILFMPSKSPPHKREREILSDVHRSKMIQLAISHNLHFAFSDLELKRKGITYTCDTLSILTKQYPQIEYYFIIGADSLFQLETWKEPEKILQMAHILVSSRYHLSESKLEQQISYLKKKYQADIHFFSMPCIEISSQFLRENLQNGKEIRYYVPDEVEDYIKKNHLYQKNKNEGKIEE